MKLFATYIYESESIDVFEEDLQCPITNQLLVDPVLISDGYTYSRHAIEPLILQAHQDGQYFVSPKTKESILMPNDFAQAIRPNLAVRNILQQQGQRNLEVNDDNFICTISYDLINIIVTNEHGKSFDEQFYNENLERRSIDPYSGTEVRVLYKNNLIQKILFRYFDKVKYTKEAIDESAKQAILAVVNNDIASLQQQQQDLMLQEVKLLDRPLFANGSTILDIIAEVGNMEMLLYLKSQNVDLCRNTISDTNALHAAAIGGNLQITKYLLEQKANFNQVSKEFKLSPLHLSCANNNIAITNLLVNSNSDINAIEVYARKNPALIAAQTSVDILLLLLSNNKLNKKIKDQKGLNIISTLASNLKSDSNQYLQIFSHFDYAQLINQENDYNYTPLHIAVINRNAEFIKAYLCYMKKFGNKRYLEICCTKGSTPLMHAVLLNDLYITNLLLDDGANPNTKLKNGYLAIDQCCIAKNLPSLQLLYSYGANLSNVQNTLADNAKRQFERTDDIPIVSTTIIDVILENRFESGLNWLCLLDKLDSSNRNIFHILPYSKCASKINCAEELFALLPPLREIEDKISLMLEQQDTQGITPMNCAEQSGMSEILLIYTSFFSKSQYSLAFNQQGLRQRKQKP